jgi:hypothetical protein
MVVLIWIFTGIWPYVKLVLSLFAWVTPTKYLSVKSRGVLLLWIDALAKLSVVDIFTLILGVAVLLVFIGGPDKSLKSDGVYYAFKAIVVPQAGFYCIIIAQRMSRVTSRFLLEYHETIVNEANRFRQESEADLSVSQILFQESAETGSNMDINLPSICPTERDATTDAVFRISNELEDSQHERNMNGNAGVRSSLSRVRTETSRSTLSSLKDYRWGHWGAILGFISIILIFTIGCIFAPSIAFDLSSIGGLTIESGKTFDDAVSEYGVFVVISGILVRASFVLDSKVDYIGLGLLLAAVAVSISLIFIVQSYQFIKRKLQERRKRRQNLECPSYGHKGCGLPFYFRLFKWNYMEIYLISLAIGVWQLGSIASYSIYMYCDIITRIYDALALLGIAEASTAQCFDLQASNPGNLIIILGSFAILLVTFYFEASGQYKKNIADCMKYVDDHDVPRLSLAWSQDKNKNSRYSHLTNSLSLDFTESVRDLSTPPSSPSLSRVSSTTSGTSGGSPLGMSPGSNHASEPLQHYQRNSSQDIGPLQQLWLQDDLESLSCPVASPIERSSSSRRSVIDASCELAQGASLNTLLGEGQRDGETSNIPSLVPSQSQEDDYEEETSLSFSLAPEPQPVAPPRRLPSIFRSLPLRPRLSLPSPNPNRIWPSPSSTPTRHTEVKAADVPAESSLARPRRVRSSEDIVHYMEENPSRFD